MNNLPNNVKEILVNIGGKSNIKTVTHCATRLRFVVKNKSKVNLESIKKIPGVITALESGGQEQVVIGPKVTEYYDEVIRQLGSRFSTNKVNTSESENETKKTSVMTKVFDTISGTFTPILPAMAGIGLTKALSIILTDTHLMSDKASTIIVLNGIYNAFFYFLPIILSFTMAKKLKADPIIAASIGAALLEPNIVKLANVHGTNIFGIPFSMMDYSSTVFPVLITIPLYACLFKFLSKKISANFKTLIVPFVSLIIFIPFVLIVLGPLASNISKLLATIITFLFKYAPIIAGALLGGTWTLLVLFGMHWAIIPLVIANIATSGSDPILGSAGAATWAAIGVCFGLLIKSKNPKLRSLMIAAIVPVLFAGITEPIVYGALLPYKRLLGYSVIAGAIGGAINALVGVKILAMFFSIVALQASTHWLASVICGICVALLVMILIIVFGYGDQNNERKFTFGS